MNWGVFWTWMLFTCWWGAVFVGVGSTAVAVFMVVFNGAEVGSPLVGITYGSFFGAVLIPAMYMPIMVVIAIANQQWDRNPARDVILAIAWMWGLGITVYLRALPSPITQLFGLFAYLILAAGLSYKVAAAVDSAMSTPRFTPPLLRDSECDS